MAHDAASGVTLVLGGARSGKSAFAETLVEKTGLEPVYVATSHVFDDEMRERIEHHRMRRGDHWVTIEEPDDLEGVIADEGTAGRALLIDCLTLWVTNLMMTKSDMAARFDGLAHALKHPKGPVVLVSNEVGLGIVPENAMARAFRDHAGRLHQDIAAVAKDVYFVAAGLPLKMKG